MIVETAWFRTRSGVSEQEFLKASKKAHGGYLSRCRGFVSRELLRAADGQWVDVVHFETHADADLAAKEFPKSPSAKDFEAAIDATTAKMMRFEIATTY